MDIDKVLDEYRKADDQKRLSLFMAYRDLRDTFEQIDNESAHDDFTILRFPWSRKAHVERAA